MAASAPGAETSRLSHRVAGKDRTAEPILQRQQEDGTTPNPTSEHCRVPSPESSCSSRGRRAFPSVRSHSSSCGSRRVLRRSSSRQEPYMPSLVPQRTRATAGQLRNGAETSLSEEYSLLQRGLKRMSFQSWLWNSEVTFAQPECDVDEANEGRHFD